MAENTSQTTILITGDGKADLVQAKLTPLEFATLNESGLLHNNRLVHVGFVWLFDRLIVVLPKAYAAPQTRKRLEIDSRYALEQAFLLIRTLARCKQENRFNTIYNQQQPFIERGLEEINKLSALEAAIELRRDYLENGLYWNKSVRFLTNYYSAPIDWNQTVRRRQPVLEGSDVLWFDTIHRSRSRNPLDYVHRLHATCIAQILELTGESSFSPQFLPLSDSEVAQLKTESDRVLNFYLSQTYRERGQRLLELIKVWLGGTSLNVRSDLERNPILLAARNFENVWEYILRSLLTDNPEQNRQLEQGQWVNNEGKQANGIKPRIDLIRSKTKPSGDYEYIFLFDAKDKQVKAGGISGSPDDHYKQIIYRKLLASQYPANLKRFYNVLLFPGINEIHTTRLLGVHQWNSIKDSEVIEVAVDYENIVQAWLNEKPFFVEDFVVQIEIQLQRTRTRAQESK
jgi:hypothetical protein